MPENFDILQVRTVHEQRSPEIFAVFGGGVAADDMEGELSYGIEVDHQRGEHDGQRHHVSGIRRGDHLNRIFHKVPGASLRKKMP